MFYVNLDASGLLDLLQIPKVVRDQVNQAGNALTAQTRDHMKRLAHDRLKTRRAMFVDGLSVFQESNDTWIINLDASVRWINDGMEPHNMLDDLLHSPKAKRSKDGSIYLIVPFSHKKGPTESTRAQANLTDTIKSEFKKFGVPYGKIEKGPDGKPLLGLLHKMDITSLPLKSFDGPGQGDGPISSVIQGPTGIPYLKGIQVYQRKVTDKNGHESVRREIMTFRVASDKQRSQAGRWDHPGLGPTHIMEDAGKWAAETWEKKIAPQLLAGIVATIG
jgi:hypothetical protein